MAATKGKITSSAKFTSGSGSWVCIASLTAGSNQKVVVEKTQIGFFGTSPTAAPIEIKISTGLTGGTGSSITPVNADPADGTTLRSTAKENYSGAPGTGTEVVRANYSCHPQQTLIVRDKLTIPAGGTMTWWVKAAAAADLNFDVGFEE